MKTFLPMSEGHPIGMVCSRSGVRVYAASPRSGPGHLRAAARFVSAMTTLLVIGDNEALPHYLQ